MKKRKSFAALIMFMCLLVTAVPVTVSAKDMKLAFNAETSGTGNAIQVRSVEYDSSDTKNGMAELEVKFSTRVQWKKSSAVTSIKDNTGNTYDGWIKDRDDDDCEIAIENLKAGRTYTIKIKGIKVRGTNGYRTLTLSGVKIPKGSSELRVESVEYDEDYDDDYDYGETAPVYSKAIFRAAPLKLRAQTVLSNFEHCRGERGQRQAAKFLFFAGEKIFGLSAHIQVERKRSAVRVDNGDERLPVRRARERVLPVRELNLLVVALRRRRVVLLYLGERRDMFGEVAVTVRLHLLKVEFGTQSVVAASALVALDTELAAVVY